ncbi:MAG: hypothetical protein ACOZF0_07985, partial [Thermodesulfobacteriota bacterium]
MAEIHQPDSATTQFSQEDIDALLRGVSQEMTAVEEIDAGQPESQESVTLEEIDRLLDIALEKAEEIESSLNGKAVAAGPPVSQDDIDALFSGGVSPAEEAAPARAVEPESGPVSQEDIDALFSGGVSPAEEAVPARA